MLIVIPRMPSERELRDLAPALPEDFEARREEFWGYVEEKIRAFFGKVNRVYCELLVAGGEEGLETIHRTSDEHLSKMVEGLLEHGAKLEATEDANLVREWTAWLEMVGNRPDLKMVEELYSECLRDRIRHISSTVSRTLGDEEIGILILSSRLTLELPDDVRVVRMCRFEPSDYVSIWLKRLELMEKRGEKKEG